MAGELRKLTLICLAICMTSSCTGQRGANYETLKQQIQKLEPDVATLKQAQLASEGPRGYLIGSDSVTLEQRKILQQENYLREQMFDCLSARFGSNRDQVAVVFAAKAGTAANTMP